MTMTATFSWRSGLAALVASAVLLGSGVASAEIRVVPKSQYAIKESFAPIVQKAEPAVVNIYVSHKVSQLESPFMADPFFRHFFGQNFGIPEQRVENSLGSGVIVSPDGVVVTNNHVIAGRGQTEITVALSDGREFGADVIVHDKRTDLAVLRLKAKGITFPYLDFANSDDVKVGDLVLAIGDPFGVGQTVTSGIVSALARTEVGISDYQFFIQTDAAINPGNSGGALVDMDGDLVGINTAIFSTSGGSHGIGFAIPANMVRLFVNAALKGTKLRQPWLGASLQRITLDLADSLGLDRPEGALISQIYPKGPAAKAGLQPGDVIVSVDGETVRDPQAVRYLIYTKGIGKTAKLGVVRNGKRFDADVALIAPIEDPPADERVLGGHTPLTGAKVANLSPAIADDLNIQDEGPGVVVMDVQGGSIADRLGLQHGDIIDQVNDTKVTSVQQLTTALALASNGWQLKILRGGHLLTLSIGG
jgi:Do/DeqQ family serine protease